MPASPIIEIKNLSAGYDNRTVLHDINLTIYEHDFLGIIGPNGGGKTTLIKCILGLLKPTAGEILYHPCSPFARISRLSMPPPQCSIIHGISTPVQQYRPEVSHYSRRSHPFRPQQQEAAYFALHRPTPGKGPPCDSPHGTGRHGTTRHRCLERRTVATRPPGPCHHIRPAGSDSRRTQHIHRQAFRSPPLRAAGRDKQGLCHYSRQPRHRHGAAASQVNCLCKRNPGLPSDTGVTEEWLERNFNCPIELLGHGTLPHRILKEHKHSHG